MVSTSQLPKNLIDQLAARYGRPAVRSLFKANVHDGGSVPAMYESSDDAGADGWQPSQIHKTFLAEWNADTDTERRIASDINVLVMTTMEPCVARDQYVRRAIERGYEL